MPQRPNVIFVLTDDQGYPPLGCHGHPFIQTPNLDAFHGESVRFEQFHTGTTCAPTRAGLMTGHYCNSTGVWHTIGGRSLLRANEWTLPSALSGAGYDTAMFGKWHLGDEYPYRPQDRGFGHAVHHGGGGISQQCDWWGNDYFDDTYMVNGEPRKYEGYCTDVFFAEAMEFIEQRASRDQPFFCYISTNAPHGPWNVEPRYRNLYMDKAEGEPYARFLGMCTNIDENFGKLRSKLQELGIEDNTVLIFMSDNGMTGVRGATDIYMGGMRGFKGSPYDGGHRVPCFVRWPAGGFAEGREIAALASYVDFMPTILDLCGVEVASDRTFHGESLVPLMRGEDDGHWAERIIATDTQRVANPLKWRQSCVMKNRWRLVNRGELYDLESDPLQERNVAADRPDVVSELQAGYERWWELCTEGIDQEIPVPVGVPGRDEAILRTHDLRNENDHAVVWNQKQVREGMSCLGWWEITVEQEGAYEFELCRWPHEAGHAVSDGIKGDDVEWYGDGVEPGSEGYYTGGKQLPFAEATLLLSGGIRKSVPVLPGDKGAVIGVDLPAGPCHVRGIFSTDDGMYTSAYYVYVRKV